MTTGPPLHGRAADAIRHQQEMMMMSKSSDPSIMHHHPSIFPFPKP
jgi:hypothetical protein